MDASPSTGRAEPGHARRCCPARPAAVRASKADPPSRPAQARKPRRAPTCAAAPATADRAPAKKRSQARLLAADACSSASLGAGGWYGYDWWTNGRFMVSTDDAYIQADVCDARHQGRRLCCQRRRQGRRQRQGRRRAGASSTTPITASRSTPPRPSARRRPPPSPASPGRSRPAGRRSTAPGPASSRPRPSAASPPPSRGVRAAAAFDRASPGSRISRAKAVLDQAVADRDRAAAAVTSAKAPGRPCSPLRRRRPISTSSRRRRPRPSRWPRSSTPRSTKAAERSRRHRDPRARPTASSATAPLSPANIVAAGLAPDGAGADGRASISPPTSRRRSSPAGARPEGRRLGRFDRRPQTSRARSASCRRLRARCSQPAAARKRHRQLHQDHAARAGPHRRAGRRRRERQLCAPACRSSSPSTAAR